MIEDSIHLYEKLPLQGTGLVMGLALLALNLFALLKPQTCLRALTQAHDATKAGTVLLGVDFVWVALLLFNAPWNPLCMPLFEFESARGLLLILCPVIWFIFSSMGKENLFPRALGFFLLLLAIVPMSAAFLKEPATRILIPLWWYPVLTIAMFWVAKPYLFRDEAAWLAKHPKLFRGAALFGTVYGAVIILCALLFW